LAHLTKNTSQANLWEKAYFNFIERGEIDKKIIRPIIYHSWVRCREMNVSPFRKKVALYSAEELKRRREENKSLLEIVEPFMQNLAGAIEYLGFLVALYDRDGCCLEMKCEGSMLIFCRSISLQVGANLREEIMGTNCVSLALTHNQLVSMKGYEYYCQIFHRLRGCAAPLHNSKREIVAILSIMGEKEISQPLNLSKIVKVCVESSENILKIRKMSDDLIVSNNLLSAIIESISNGIIAYDRKGKIKEINSFALQKMGMKKEEIREKTIDEITLSQPSLGAICREEQEYKNKEIKILAGGKEIRCLGNITNIKNKHSASIGQVLTFREIKEIGRLVGKVVTSRAKYTFEDIIGKSKSLIEMKRLAAIASQSLSNVLVQGESGTGKELFAQAIHNASPRADFPFIAVNCAAIPRELIESELFGYVEGAFTGARKGGGIGKFELAEGGTIFLDEIGDMPLDMQIKLLRVLQNKEFFRIGGTTPIAVNVRVISATNKDLLEEIKKGRFREELYYRLNVLTIITPPLRERKEDIKILSEHFIQKLNKILGKKIVGLSEEVEQIFYEYSWPGNVRELENVIEYAMTMARGEIITSSALPELKKRKDFLAAPISENLLPTPKEILEDPEKKRYEQALKLSGGNILEAAKLLNISRATIYRKIKKYGLRKN
jgi:PAS domain S-box-containing protein